MEAGDESARSRTEAETQGTSHFPYFMSPEWEAEVNHCAPM